MSDAIDEKITVKNALPLAAEVDVTTTTAAGEASTVTLGPIEAGAQESVTVSVEPGGSFALTGRWDFEGEARSSNTYTVNVPPDTPLTPLTVSLKMPFDTPTKGQWKDIEWEMPPGAE